MLIEVTLLAASLSGQVPPMPDTDPCLSLAYVAAVASEYRELGMSAGDAMRQALRTGADTTDARRRMHAARIGYAAKNPESAGRLAYLMCARGGL